MIGRLIGRISILDEARKGNGRKLNLLVRELIELRNRDISGALHPAEIRLIRRRVPLEEGGVVNVIFDGEVERVRHERGDRGNLVQRGNRRAKYVNKANVKTRSRTASRNPISSHVFSVGPRRPARISTTLTFAPVSCKVSRIFIWSLVWVRSITSVRSG